MEDVSPAPRPDRRRTDESADRGQLILISGLAVAATLVAVVLLLNTVIYTQNLATRGDGIEDGEAVSFRQEVAEGVGGVVDAENRAEHANRSLAVENVTDAVLRYDRLVSRYHAERGAVASIDARTVTRDNVTNGTLLRQTDASRNFTNETGAAANWTLAEDVSDLRRFRLTVTDDELVGEGSSPFSVRLDDGASVQRVYVYENADGDIAVSDGAGDAPGDPCTVSGPAAAVDLTAGTVNGTACPELDYPAEMDGYAVGFRNGGKAAGTYELTVSVAGAASVAEGNFAGPGDEASPRAVPAVYAAEFGLRFETPNLVFDTDLRVAPGEPS